MQKNSFALAYGINKNLDNIEKILYFKLMTQPIAPYAGEINFAKTLIASDPRTTPEEFGEMIYEEIKNWELPAGQGFHPDDNFFYESIKEDLAELRNGSTFNEIIGNWRDRLNEFWHDYASQCVDG